MKDHELKVKVKSNGQEMIISKARYAEYPGGYEVLEGKPENLSKTGETFTPPAPPSSGAKEPAAKKATATAKK